MAVTDTLTVLKQITTLVLTLQVSFSKDVNKIDDTTGKGPTITRNDVIQKKMIFRPDLTTEHAQMYAGTTNTVGQTITDADNFTMADDALDTDTSNDVLNPSINSLQRFVLNTVEHQKDTIKRFNDALSDLQDKVYGDELKRQGNECLPPDCREASESGILKIKPPGTDTTPIDVYCTKDDASGDPWTVIQRRTDGKLDFDQMWNEYKMGFGNLDGEFWLGLEHIYALTNKARYELRITLKNWNGTINVAYYDNFLISEEESNYRLKGIGRHSGNATDSLKALQSGAMWSTTDKDNDFDKKRHCATHYKSGWWYRHCALSNLNGAYPTKEERFTEETKGIYWGSMQKTSFEASEMAIRIRKKP